MAGAMAGSAVLQAPHRSSELEIVTLTINDDCNLKCPHCYLQYGVGVGGQMAWDDVIHILDSPAKHFAIVGKEPLANRKSAALTARLVEAVHLSARSASIITNGLNLRLLDQATLERLAWIDVSVDGSAQFYQGYRGGSFAKLSAGVAYARSNGLADLRVLHTVSSANIEDTAAALETARSLGAGKIVISPFQATRAIGLQSVKMVAPSTLLDVLELAEAHKDPAIWLTLDRGYTGGMLMEGDILRRAIELFGDRLIYVTSDPIDRGLVRVTYDGLVLSPFESVHTADYGRCGRPLRERSLSDWYQTILGDAARAEMALCAQ